MKQKQIINAPNVDMNGIKPPYKIPSMLEIEAIPWNGYNVVSTFSGGGGSCLGYRMAGYRVLWANEFVEEAQNTYTANHPHTYLDTRDIRSIKPEEILETIRLRKGEIDLFDGSPPCCAFSTAGSVEKGWGKKHYYSDGKNQKIEDLFFEFIRILNGLQPKTFVAENVSGLIKGKSIGYFKEFIKSMKQCGYKVKAKLLNSAYLGVPQFRERIIFVGVRNDLGLDPVFPLPFKYCYTLRDALDNCVRDEEEIKFRIDKMSKTKMGEILEKIPKNPYKNISASTIMNGSYFNMARMSFYKPCATITATNGHVSAAGLCHPIENRKFTISELKRISSLPDDFVLTGNYNQQGERIGRMVPPIMMMNIAKTVQTEILDKFEG